MLLVKLLFTCAFAFMPESLDQWYSLCSRGDWMEAALNAEAILLQSPDDVQVMSALVIARYMDTAARNVPLYLPDFLPDSTTSLSAAASGLILVSGGASFTEDALSRLQQSVMLDSSNVLGWYLLGRLSPDTDIDPVHYYATALALDPDFVPAELEMGRLLRDAGRTDEALARFASAASEEGFASELARGEQILLLERTGNFSTADSIAGTLDGGGYWTELALEQLSHREKIALAAAEHAYVFMDRDLPDIRLARVFLLLKDYARAADIAEDIWDPSDPETVQAGEILGESLFMLNERSRAREVLEGVTATDAPSASASLFLGRIAEQEGRTEDATDRYLEVLRLDVYHQEARSSLRTMAEDSYDPLELTEEATGFSASASADLSLEKGNRDLLEWGGSSWVDYRFDSRGTRLRGSIGGRSVTWEEYSGSGTDTLNTNRGWAGLTFDYWFTDRLYLQASSSWDRQMYTQRTWQVSSHLAGGWEKTILNWFRFSPRAGIGSVDAHWKEGATDTYTHDLSLFTAAGLWFNKGYTFISEAEISGEVYVPVNDPGNFISQAMVSVTFRTWTPLHLRMTYQLDYTRRPEIESWTKYETSFTTAIGLDLY